MPNKRVAYRRYSGKLLLEGDKITSTRGSWVEKRTALLREIGKRATIVSPEEESDILFVEFGSLNERFYGDDIAETMRLVKLHKRKVYFICDDPELVPKDVAEWVDLMLVNANPEKCAREWKVPCSALYFHSLIERRPYNPEHNNRLVYWGGSSGGREKMLKLLMTVFPIEIYGKQNDFTELSVKEAPTQDKRMDFYSKFSACLSIRDKKHKRLGWKTGRHYHAINAGIPAVEFPTQDVFYPEQRKELYDKQVLEVEIEKEKTLWNLSNLLL